MAPSGYLLLREKEKKNRFYFSLSPEQVQWTPFPKSFLQVFLGGI